MTFKNLFDESPERIRHYAKRGAAKQAALYVIDGQYVTADERAKAKPGPMTWAKLGVRV